MSILLICGVPGSGKSYGAVQLAILPALELGRPIRTNMQLAWDEIRQCYPGADVQAIDTEAEGWAPSIPGGALVVLDEVWKFWPSGQRADAADAEQKELIAMHRHRVGDVQGRQLSMEMVIISQGSSDIASWVRSKVDKTYQVSKLDAVGAEKRFRCDVYQGWIDTKKPLKRAHIRGYMGSYKPEVYRYYVSHTQADAPGDAVDVKELRADAKATVWHSWPVRAALLAVPAFFVLSGYAATHFGEFLGAPAEPVVASEPPRAETQPRAQGSAVERPKPVVSQPAVAPKPGRPPAQAGADTEWRMVAWLEREGQYAVILKRGRDRRYLTGVKCKQTEYGELGCEIEGEKVTSWSGSAIDPWDVVDPGPPAM